MSTNKQPKSNGYPLDELLSALQKDIRRGNEESAMHWAVHIENINPKALWNRLKIIASEDVGLGCPMMPVLIETLKSQYERDKSTLNPSSYRLFLTNAVLQLCYFKKSRIVDDLLWVVYGEIEHEGMRLDIPSYALDHHTERGRQLNKWNVWEEKGCKITNETNISNPYTERAKEIRRKYKTLSNPSQKLKKRKKSKKKPTSSIDKYV